MAILAGRTTRVLVQGITGREAATFTVESIRYGTNIVAGVTPGKGGTKIHEVPVFDTVSKALREQPCDTTVISVPPWAVRDAAWEALDAGIRLLVIVTERIPRCDVVAILEYAKERVARVIGPNSLGVISPHQCRIGMCGGSVEAIRKAYSPGPVGIISRSGGMMTEIASLLTQAGIGQTSCVSTGGDPIIGSTFADLLPLYEADAETKALVLFCEPGGTMEEKLAEYLAKNPSRLGVVAFIAGRFTDRMQGVRFGHAGAIVEGTRGSPWGKVAALRKVDILIAEKLSRIPDLVRVTLNERRS